MENIMMFAQGFFSFFFLRTSAKSVPCGSGSFVHLFRFCFVCFRNCDCDLVEAQDYRVDH